ncbi:unnamed protein product [Blepharisma stoltei]|uniref:Uncharacterized protein n=1 Tax=Blepharisma stoltei TaxID=1481888 RepID=A0AAU9K9D2_9CILI|nr:unnamed protein product [Blepharisma stoltei]
MKSSTLGIGLGLDAYSSKPSYKDKFCPLKAKEIIKEIVERQIGPEDKYQGRNNTNVNPFPLAIAEEVRAALKEGHANRYKIMVQVVVGEKLGQGVRMGSKCFWDEETDNAAWFSYSNDFMFCVVSVFASYLY